MRITFVLPNAALTGGNRVLAIHAKQLHELGHKVMVVSQPPAVPRLRSRIRSLLTGRGWPQRTPAGPSFFDGTGVPHRILARLRVVAFGAKPVSAQLPLPGWVEFHHRSPQYSLRFLYARCDVWLCTSRREGFGLPLLEGMACRCPVVSTRCGGPAEFVVPGVNSYLADVDDVEGLADQRHRVLAMSGEAWHALSSAAHATAHDYSWRDAVALFERALQDIASPSRRATTGDDGSQR